MKILVDENIPLARELFGALGDVTLAAGRDVDENYAGLDEFDALAIRSVTKITPALVDRAASARVIGTATIGMDHIDVGYIEQANATRENPIAVFSAPGSNADSVADYVWYCLMRLTSHGREPLSRRTLGIIGHGNCGSRVARRAEGFGMRVLRYDPPLAERDTGFVSDSFEDTLAADFVTCHVPLTREGESAYPTYHLIGEHALSLMQPGAYLINSSRGAVVDSQALIQCLQNRAIAGAVLDVYEGEPEPAEPLIVLPEVATPHIAGYAIEAKRRGAVVIYEAMCHTFGVEPMDTQPLLMRGLDPPEALRVSFPAGYSDELDADAAVRCLMSRIYDVDATSRELKATLGCPDRGTRFDSMRKDYERDYARHELAAYTVGFSANVAPQLRGEVERRLQGFGVRTAGEDANFILTPA